jgi:hypothetical protein
MYASATFTIAVTHRLLLLFLSHLQRTSGATVVQQQHHQISSSSAPKETCAVVVVSSRQHHGPLYLRENNRDSIRQLLTTCLRIFPEYIHISLLVLHFLSLSLSLSLSPCMTCRHKRPVEQPPSMPRAPHLSLSLALGNTLAPRPRRCPSSTRNNRILSAVVAANSK